jgi:sulfur carrier protein
VNVTVNGEARELAEGARVADVVAGMAGTRKTGIAVAVNGEVVPKSAWAAVPLGEDDRVEILSAIGGG